MHNIHAIARKNLKPRVLFSDGLGYQHVLLLTGPFIRE